MMRAIFLALCAVSAVMPFFERSPHKTNVSVTSSPPWPSTFQNRTLQPLPETADDAAFAASFPGAIARFTDGERNFILRWVTTATRKVHPSADCFRGLGYDVFPLSPYVDSAGCHWNCFLASRGATRLRVHERITAMDGTAWTDVSAWFWSALRHKTRGPWLAVTVVQTDSGSTF